MAKRAEGERRADATDPNALVEPIHDKAMPVLLLTQEEVDVWMRLLGMKQRRLPGHFRQMP